MKSFSVGLPMEIKVFISHIVSLIAVIFSVWLTHYYTLKKIRFEYFLKTKLEALLDLHKSVVECKETLYYYANLLENYEDKSCEEKRLYFLLKFNLKY